MIRAAPIKLLPNASCGRIERVTTHSREAKPPSRALGVAHGWEIRACRKMSLPLRIEGFLALLILLCNPANVSSSELRMGFGFCPVPFAPTCAGVDAVYGDNARAKACQEEVTHYVNTVVAYRACLLQEMERAVLETNNILDRFKCGVAARHRCPAPK
jgi:hypothetical protein